MPNDRISEAKYLLHKLLAEDGSDLVHNHPWIWEVDRWKELVFSLLTRTADVPEHGLRVLVDDLERLGLLDVALLARMAGASDPSVRGRFVKLLQERGLSEEDARRAMTTLCEAAVGLQNHHQGKIQHYLRHYGEMMLRDLPTTFRFTALSEQAAREAITYWLQNVANVPLSLADTSLDQFCRENQLSIDDIFAAADAINLNVALVDDLAQRYVERRRLLEETIGLDDETTGPEGG